MTQPASSLQSLLESYDRTYRRAHGNIPTDAAVTATFTSCPRNDSLPAVLQKVAILNGLYHTNVLDVHRMGKQIVSMRIDRYLDKPDARAVDSIRRGHGIASPSGRDRDFYSFATKYCHWHRPGFYPMYDSYVVSALRWLAIDRRLTPKFDDSELLDFAYFKGLLDRLRRRVGHHWTYKRLDQALWMLGQEVKK